MSVGVYSRNYFQEVSDPLSRRPRVKKRGWTLRSLPFFSLNPSFFLGNVSMSSEPFISNDLFLLYSNVILDQIYSPEEVYEKMVNAPKDKVIFIKMDCLDFYLPWLVMITEPYVLITTGNDDLCLPYYMFPPEEDIKKSHDSLLAYPYLKQWMTKNPSIVHPKLIPLPLGPKWQYTSFDFFGEDKGPILEILHRHCTTPVEYFYSPKSKLVYVNFDTITTSREWMPFYQPHVNLREVWLYECRHQGYEIAQSSPYEEYLNQMKEYKFCMCPPGHGIDTHRVFESLMVGTIPIMMTSPLDSMYEDLPVLIIKSMSMIRKEYLEEQYEKIKKKAYNFEKLYAPYWKKRIQGLPGFEPGLRESESRVITVTL